MTDKAYEESAAAFLRMERIEEAEDLTYEEAQFLYKLLEFKRQEIEYNIEHIMTEGYGKWIRHQKQIIDSIIGKLYRVI